MFESVRNEIKKEQFIYFSSTILNEIVFLQCHNLKSIVFININKINKINNIIY